jgi:pyrroloquinoline quinone (PQQ) biosynthesis protein C
MKTYDRLYMETSDERERFLAIPLVRHALANGGTREMYLDFLQQAYHHVKHTFRLLALAASRTSDERYQAALLDYMREERGHEKWILDDIRALGGDARATEDGEPGVACQVMVGHAYYLVEHVSPYALLGMVHVLEGLSVMLADKVAEAVRASLGKSSDDGFTYLRSHGALDQDHVRMFRNLVNGIADPGAADIIIRSAKTFYRLYGAIFEELGEKYGMRRHAA